MKERKLDAIHLLYTKLYGIQCQNWIEKKGYGPGGAGLTLEWNLGKEQDKLSLPDYHGIEIKTQRKGSTYAIGLFSMALDNKPLEMQRLLKLVGYPDYQNHNYKALNVTVCGNQNKTVGNYVLKLHVNYERKIIQLMIYSRSNKLIDDTMSWSFKELQIRLQNKLSYLVIVPNSSYTIQNKTYFKYHSPTFYRLKDFSDFLKAVENGIVTITFHLSFDNRCIDGNGLHDHGTTFGIYHKDIETIFYKLEPDDLNNE